MSSGARWGGGGKLGWDLLVVGRVTEFQGEVISPTKVL